MFSSNYLQAQDNLKFYIKKALTNNLTLNAERKNEAMLVGGCVRNFLNNEKIGDIDIATIFTQDEIIKKFSKRVCFFINYLATECQPMRLI